MDKQNQHLMLIDQRIQNMISQIYTALPGEILSYDGKFATVQPTVKKDLQDGRSLSFPNIPNVLVQFPTGNNGTAGVSFPIKKGDTGLLIFASQSIDGFLSGGQASDPRRHDLTDCIFVPGLWPFSVPAYSKYPDDTVLFNGGSILRVSASKVYCNVDMEIEGNVSISKRLSVVQGTTSNGISFEDHVHDGVQQGTYDTGKPKGGGA